MKNIISASRRTDIPRYFGEWLRWRLKAGFAQFRNCNGGAGEVSLAREDVLGYLFWTKYPHPRLFMEQVLEDLLADGVPCGFNITVTGYGRDLEPFVPRRARSVDGFLEVASLLPSPECIQWRYDPIVISDRYTASWHLENFRRLAQKLEGATRVVNTKVLEPFLKTVRRVKLPGVKFRAVDPGRHRTVSKSYPDLSQAGPLALALVKDLREVAAEHGMELRSCTNPELGLPPSRCCGVELFIPYGIERELASVKPGPSRNLCGCLKTVDVGMDATCLGGCEYCYVVGKHETAVGNFRDHDPRAPMIRMPKRSA